MAVFRSTLQELADTRIREARILLRAKEYAGACHIAGFAIECAFKACIAKSSRRYEFPDKNRAKDCWTHSLPALLKFSGLSVRFDSDVAANPALKTSWDQVSKWDPEVRYDPSIRKVEAVDFCNAVDDPRDGILTWIRAYW